MSSAKVWTKVGVFCGSIVLALVLIVLVLGLMLDVRARNGLQITSAQDLFQGPQRGQIWDTVESQTRISTVFPPEKLAQVFRISEAELVAYQNWGHKDAPYASAFTKDRLSRFRLELEYKWGDRTFAPREALPRDSGIIFHAFEGDLTPWPSGVEFQLKQPDNNGELVLVRTRAKLFDAQGRSLGLKGARKGATKTNTGLHDQPTGWNHVRIDVNADRAAYYLNGQLTSTFEMAEYFNPYWRIWRPLKSGRIVLQAEGAEISFRNVSVSALEQEVAPR